MSSKNVELLARGLQAQRRSTLVWASSIVLLAVSVVALWPSLERSGSLGGLTAGMSPQLVAAFGLGEFNTANGYLRGNLYAVMLPLLLGSMAITAATALTSGDEEAGRFELLLALPLRRTQVLLMRLLTVVISLALTSAAVAVTVAGSVVVLDMDVALAGVFAVALATWLLAVFHASLAYAAAAAGCRPQMTVGVAAGVLVVGYMLQAVVPLSKSLKPLSALSPWDWALGHDPLRNGFAGGGLMILLAVSVVLVAVGTVLINRRDIRTV
jgi:ABC-2 type transport system permease protein